jgi:hypothetical protein
VDEYFENEKPRRCSNGKNSQDGRPDLSDKTLDDSKDWRRKNLFGYEAMDHMLESRGRIMTV